ncbi:uncharacterized protein LOC124531753 [Vanessa cardui]|uniref:uncharacterized protein LOC124531753 n=1 Tax=Vanessa cardui TaxID=171605 RepID=UPI001F134EC9|nr:uncharacterized protein LOC124531753 [Vanessa cardui]
MSNLLLRVPLRLAKVGSQLGVFLLILREAKEIGSTRNSRPFSDVAQPRLFSAPNSSPSGNFSHHYEWSGINIFDEENEIVYKFKRIHYVIFVLYICSALSHSQYVIQEVLGGTDLIELAVDLSYSFNCFEGCLLYLHFCGIKNRIKDYVVKLGEEWRDDESLTAKSIAMKRNQIKHIDIYTLALNISYVVTCSLFFISVTMSQLRTLYMLLQEDFREVIKSKDVDLQIKQIVQRHSALSDLLIEMSDAFGAIFAIHVLFLSVTICFYGIAARALDVATVAYDSAWEDLSCKKRKIILLTILRSQQASYIRSMKCSEISLKTFVTIMNMTWSFISLVTKLYQD